MDTSTAIFIAAGIVLGAAAIAYGANAVARFIWPGDER